MLARHPFDGERTRGRYRSHHAPRDDYGTHPGDGTLSTASCTTRGRPGVTHTLAHRRIVMRTWIAPLASLAVPLLVAALWLARAGAEPPRTAAEKTDYQTTSRYAEVVEFCEQMAKESPLVRLGEMGTTHEGRKLPLMILADPPVATPEEAARSNKLIVFAMGNI